MFHLIKNTLLLTILIIIKGNKFAAKALKRDITEFNKQ